MSQAIDPERVDEFSGRLLQHFNGAAITQLLSVGRQTGLFDTLAGLKPSTCEEIADASGLNERYLREWLNGLVVAGILEFDADVRTYSLPPEHAACLTTAAGLRNMTPMARLFPMLGAAELDVIRSFSEGGGVPYSKYRGFTDVMAERSGQRFDALLLDHVLPAVPGLISKLKQGIDVADVGCGSGHAVNLMAEAFPNSRFTGYDFSENAVESAIKESARLGLANTEFVASDAASLEMTHSFDFVTTFDAIHDQARPRKALQAVFNSLRPGGIYLMVEPSGSGSVESDIGDPLAIFKYTVSLMHCMTVSLSLDGDGLGTMWGEPQARAFLKEAGFSEVDKKKVDGDALNDYFIALKS